ncbi:stage II sporulation protein R [Blautia liquoris]|uniref:Stage II sporulation protein R n=1 Tax=Blautia liquoris TaxID=2779518 RepID=A0A7M2RH80_9FIRM|nr:stage II sporulation protein R [Blautia liquoris]QOV19693.1 stage II sporulation protein R [Blautia liquoris]
MRRSVITWAAAIFMGIFAAIFAGETQGKEAALQQEIAKEVIRFHVLADSDQVKDQEIKLEVKECLLDHINFLIRDAGSLEETKAILKNNTDYLQREAKKCLKKKGNMDSVTVSYETDHFPVKSYGEYTFPAGQYEALRVKIGRARGHNWWCMLYPSLCFQDSLHPVLKEEKLDQVLSDDAYDSILKTEKPHFTFRWFDLKLPE